jgi:hypothetical protein
MGRVSGRTVLIVFVQAIALSWALAGCTNYKGEVYFDPFRELERQGGKSISVSEFREREYQEEDRRMRAQRRQQQQRLQPQPQQQALCDLFSGPPDGAPIVWDTTDGTTDPGPGWWTTHGSVPGQELKKCKVDANVTLEEKRSRNDGNGSRQ